VPVRVPATWRCFEASSPRLAREPVCLAMSDDTKQFVLVPQYKSSRRVDFVAEAKMLLGSRRSLDRLIRRGSAA